MNIKTINDLKNASDKELLTLYQDAQGKTSNFREEFETDFSYSSLTNEIQNRGYVQGWYKPNEKKIVQIKLSGGFNRVPVKVSSDVEKEWNDFTCGSTQKSLYASAAFKHFMSDYKAGQVSITLSD